MSGAAALMDTVEVVIKQPNHADRVVRLSEGATRMGRAEDNEIVLSDGGVSRRHAQVFVSHGEVTVEDLGSGNGTYYNGYRIQRQPVHDGDEIVVDPFVLQFKIRSATGHGTGHSGHGRAEGGSPAPARLQVVVGSGMAGSSYPITSRGLSIGRSEDRDVVVADPAASRHHCQIAQQGGEYVLRDMGSANGVFVNAVRVRECTLADGDLIRIGNTEMRFVRYDGAADVGRSDYAPRQQSQSEPWSEPHGQRGGNTGRTGEYQPPPPRRRGAGRILALMFTGLIVFLALMVVALFLVVGGVLLFKNVGGAPTRAAREAHPPRWSLNLQSGLEPAPVNVLFEQGQNKMRERQHRDALQDFYRVLSTDPGYPYVDKFAFAAGEFLVLDTLAQEVSRRAGERVKREAERDQLLEDLNSKRRASQLKAERALRRQFADDPKVMARLKLDTPASVVATEKLAKAGAEAMAAGHFDEASRQFLDVLERSKSATDRAEALAKLRMSQKEVARASAELWQQAVETEAAGQLTDAKTVFLTLRDQHPSNPSVDAHLARLP
ncbi:MAG: FHA domain-containing protein [Myxococcota bacterium]